METHKLSRPGSSGMGFSATTGISKKLITIFARHLDSFIVIPKLSSVYQIRNAGSGQFLPPGQFYHGVLHAGKAKVKTSTSNLFLLSVLSFHYCLLIEGFSFVFTKMTPFSPALPYSLLAAIIILTAITFRAGKDKG
jgi:hypothetical protein